MTKQYIPGDVGVAWRPLERAMPDWRMTTVFYHVVFDHAVANKAAKSDSYMFLWDTLATDPFYFDDAMEIRRR